MSSARIELPAPHIGQRNVEACTARFVILCCGRRWGKDVLLERRTIKRALKLRQAIGWFAPTYRMMTENYREIRHILSPVITRASETEHRIDLITGNSIEMWSLDNPDAGRGRHYGHVSINEAAMVKDLVDAWNMVIRPTLADHKGSADFGSTPKGLNGFYDIWQMAGASEDWQRFHYPTDTNPHIPKEEIEAMRKSLPERVVKQEIDAEFVEDGAYFQNIDKCAILPERESPEQHEGHTKFMALDWGKSGDWSVFGVGCQDCKKVVDWDRFQKVDYIYQRERFKSIFDRWQPAGVLPERNSMGEPNVELLAQDGYPILSGPDGKLGFETMATTKPPLIEKLAQAFILNGFLVPLEAREELTIYEENILESGRSRFTAPGGKHDDWVMMLALLWRAMTTGSSVFLFGV